MIRHYNKTARQLGTALLMAALLLPAPLIALEASRIQGSPLTVPESLLRKMHTPRLKADADKAVINYMATQDAHLIRDWLRSEGYLDAQVSGLAEDGIAGWHVEAGPLWRIRSVRLAPAGPVKISLPQNGAVFRTGPYEAAKTALLWSWRDAGYLKADFDQAVVTPDELTHQVDIVWHINPGPLFHISLIRIEGARQFTADLPLQLSRLKPGEVPTRQRLQDAMQRISDDPRYQHAMVAAQPGEASGEQVPVRISVSEAGWGRMSGDVGYSTDLGLGLGANWGDRRLLDGRLEYSLRGATSRNSSGIGATLMRPTWPGQGQKIGMDADYNRVATDGRRYDSLSGGPFWQLDFGRSDYLRMSIHAENISESGIGLLSLGPRVDLHFSHEQGRGMAFSGWKLDAGFGLPQRVNTQGLWTVMDIAGRFFYQPTDWLLASPRAGYGRTLNLQGTVPKTYRQFAGGAGSVRGYSLDSLGPIGADGLATGGLMKTFTGLDLVLMPNTGIFSPVLFSDAAKLWQAIGSNTPWVKSAGMGGIAHTPAGPLRIDLAFPLNRRSQDASFQLYITLGEIF